MKSGSFYNRLNRKASLLVQGLRYDVCTSDGARVGFNPDTTTDDFIRYTWYAEREGCFLFSDLADPRSGEESTNVHGLFGAIIVEAPQSVWTDPVTGGPLASGLFADIHHPVNPSFREYAVFFHDELEIKKGEPTKIRLIHGGIKETHVFHLHNHQWRLDPDDSKSTIIDSISISPQECNTLDVLYGAGSLNRTVGDIIFHCHLYPHFHEGMWTLWRIFDRLEDGTGRYPDGSPIEALRPLPDRMPPLQKDTLHPGYPNFINGQFGERPLQPPLGVLTPDGDNKIPPRLWNRQILSPRSRRARYIRKPVPATQVKLSMYLTWP